MNRHVIGTIACVAMVCLLAVYAPDARAQGAILPGQTLTGSITPAGDADSWTFSAATGDAIVLRIGEITQSGSFTPRIRLFDPSSAPVATSAGVVAAEVVATAAASGTYTAIVDDIAGAGATASGTYRITLAKTGSAIVVSAGDEGGPLTNGLMHAGTIDVGDLDVWTFAATAGDSILVRMGETTGGSALSPFVRLYSPSGTLVDSSFNNEAAEVVATAPATGTYVVVVGDGSNGLGGSGGYRLSLAKSGSAVSVSAGDEGGALVNGAMHTGTIDVGDLDVWTVTAATGEGIVVRMGVATPGGALTPFLRLYGPTGALLDSNFSDGAAEVTTTAGASGTFLVVAGDATSGYSGSGGYRLSLAKTGTPVTVSGGDQGGALINGAMHLGVIDVGDLDVWTVDAQTGDNIVVRMGEITEGSALTPQLRLYSPAGTLLVNSFSPAGAEVGVTVLTSGTYLIVASDASSGLGGSGNYRLTLAKTATPVTVSPGDEGGPMINGAVHTGTLDVGDLDLWTVNAFAGQSIVLRMGETTADSSLSPWLRLYSPTGALLSNNSSTATAEVSTIAPIDGTYLVVAADASSGYGGSGGYQLVLAKTGDPVVVSPGDQGGPLTNGAIHTGSISVGDLDVWTFDAVAGDGILVRMGKISAASSLTPYLRIFSPTGVQLDSSFSTSAAEVATTAPVTGTYIVVAGDRSAGFSGSGDYRITLAKTGSPVVVSPGDEGGPMTNGLMHTGTLDVGDLDLWTVNANAGESFVVRMGEVVGGSALTPFVRIYGPNGALLNGVTSLVATEVSVAGAVAGTYLVVVGDASASFGGSGEYRLTLAKSGTPVVVSPGDQGGALPNGTTNGVIDFGDLDVYTIAATIGDHLVVTMTEIVGGSTLSPYLRLYSPTGALVGEHGSTSSAQISLTTTASGLFLLVAADGFPFDGSGGYSLTLSGASGLPTLDVDRSIDQKKYDGLTDGLLVIRYLFGLTGTTLTTNALGETATRTDPNDIKAYLDSMRSLLDVDLNGTPDGLTDGLMIVRYLFGLRGNTLINNALGMGATRTDPTAIENYIRTLMP